MSGADTVGDLEQSVWLAAIGKHPGWNDHLDDIGVETPRLVSLKTSLYVDGIGGVIDSGAWESLSETARDPGYAHSFFWRAPDGMVVGRMWSSSDGKGRTKYPMIACAMCRGYPLSFMAGPVLDRLRRLEDECRATDSAAGVIAATDRVRAELRELAGFAPRAEDGPIDAEPAAVTLLDAKEAVGEDGVGIHRVLYELERYWKAFLMVDRERTGSRSRSMEVRSQQVRVPAVDETVGGAWSVWARLLLHRVDPLAPLLFISRDDRPWLDIIVGDPGPGQLSCLQRTLEDLPYTTDIEYEIDAEIAYRTDELIDRSKAREVDEHDPATIDAPKERLAAFLKLPSAKPSPSGDTQADRRLLYGILAAAAVLVIVALIAFAVLGSGGGGGAATHRDGTPVDGQPEPPRVRTAERPPPRASPVETVPSLRVTDGVSGDPPDNAPDELVERRTERYRRWCVLAADWYEPFRAALNEASPPDFSHLGGPVRAALELIDRGDVEIDPTVATPGRFASIDRLLESPPRVVGEGGLDAETEAALAAIERVRATLRADAWAARSALDRALSRVGGGAPPGLSALASALDGDDGVAAFEAATRLEAFAPGLERIAAGVERLDVIAAELRDAGAEEQAGCLVGLPAGGEGPDEAWIASTGERLERLADLGESLLEAAGGIGRIDPVLRDAALADRGGDRCTGEDSLRAWARVMGDRSLYLLDPARDPRRGLPGDDRLADLGERIGAIRQENAAASATLAPEQRAVAELLASVRALGWNEQSRAEVERQTEAVRTRFDDLANAVDAAEREQALESESYIAMLVARESVPQTASPAIDDLWRGARDEAIAEFRAGGSLVDLSRRIEAIEAEARALEAAVPPLTLDLSVFGSAADQVARLADGAREDLIQEVGLRESTDAAAERYARWVAQVSGSAAAASALRATLDAWTPEEDAGYGALLGAWRDSWAGQRVTAGDVDPRFGVLEDGMLEGERAALVAVLTDSGVPAALRYLGWRRLGTDETWPVTVADFRADASAAATLQGALAELAPERRAAVKEELSGGVADRWRRLASRADGWTAFASAAEAATDFGVEPEGLSVELMYNTTVAGWRRNLAAGDPPQAHEVVSFARAVIAETGGVADESARGWLEQLAEDLSGRGDDRVDFASVGPGKAGWEAAALPNGRFVEYSLPRRDAAPLTIGFSLVAGGAGGPVYVAETEAPVSLLLSAVLDGPFADDVMSLLEADWGAYGDPRVGPCVWAWGKQRTGGRGVQLNAGWTARARFADGGSIYAPGLGGPPEPPTEDHPLQRVTAHAAAAIAAVVGCRLPTADEWRAAYAQAGRPTASADWNLRDAAFETQRAFIESLGDIRSPPWPDLGVFISEDESPASAGEAISHPWSDGVLWLRGVRDGPDREFRHIVGNVAEYVQAGSGRAPLRTDTPAETRTLLAALDSAAREPDAFAVIGGSALSPPSVGVTDERRVDVGRSLGGYADVGFRLAFSPGGPMPPRVIIAEALRAAPYLRSD
jgi:hypothetical protein